MYMGIVFINSMTLKSLFFTYQYILIEGIYQGIYTGTCIRCLFAYIFFNFEATNALGLVAEYEFEFE